MIQSALNKAQETVLRLIRRQAYANAQNALLRLHPADLAALFHHLTDVDQKWFAETVLKTGKLGGVLAELDGDLVEKFLRLIPEGELVTALQLQSPDDVVDVLSRLDEDRQRRLFEQLIGAQKIAVGKLLGFAADTAGGIMTTDFVAVPVNATVSEAITTLRNQEKRPEMFYIYVVDDEQRLTGVASFRDLVLSEPSALLSSVMTKDPAFVRSSDEQEAVASTIAKYNLLALPVVDEEQRLIGQITVDDAIDVLYEEATEDIYHLANLGEEEHIGTSVRTSTRRRAPWLLINLGTAILAATVVGLFSETISQYVVLAVLMPIVAGMGGNAGTQSLAVVVRSLALGEIDTSLGLRVIAKEVRVGFLNGLITGLAMAIIALLWYHNIVLAAIMFLAMIGNLVIAGLFGAFVPLMLKRLNLDPALGSSIVVTTATDVGGFFVFLGLASVMINSLVGA